MSGAQARDEIFRNRDIGALPARHDDDVRLIHQVWPAVGDHPQADNVKPGTILGMKVEESAVGPILE